MMESEMKINCRGESNIKIRNITDINYKQTNINTETRERYEAKQQTEYYEQQQHQKEKYKVESYFESEKSKLIERMENDCLGEEYLNQGKRNTSLRNNTVKTYGNSICLENYSFTESHPNNCSQVLQKTVNGYHVDDQENKIKETIQKLTKNILVSKQSIVENMNSIKNCHQINSQPSNRNYSQNLQAENKVKEENGEQYSQKLVGICLVGKNKRKMIEPRYIKKKSLEGDSGFEFANSGIQASSCSKIESRKKKRMILLEERIDKELLSQSIPIKEQNERGSRKKLMSLKSLPLDFFVNDDETHIKTEAISKVLQKSQELESMNTERIKKQLYFLNSVTEPAQERKCLEERKSLDFIREKSLKHNFNSESRENINEERFKQKILLNIRSKIPKNHDKIDNTDIFNSPRKQGTRSTSQLGLPVILHHSPSKSIKHQQTNPELHSTREFYIQN